jgi:hypothetical protein
MISWNAIQQFLSRYYHFEYKMYYFNLFILVSKVFSHINYHTFFILKITGKIREQRENKNRVRLTFN